MDYDCEFVLNYDETLNCGAELRMDEGFAVTSKANFTVPPRCIEVVLSRRSRMILFINPSYYQKWLPGPALNIFSATGASSSSSSTEKLQPRVNSNTPWDNALARLWYGKARSENIAVCPWCYKKEAFGTIACYRCGVTMTNSPISVEQVRQLAADPTAQLLNSLGLIRNKPESDNPRRYRGATPLNYTKTWEQRCKGWLRGTVKKKDPDTGEYLYRSSENPITDR